MSVSETVTSGQPTGPAARPGHHRSRRHIWPLLGPAFVAAVAYVDPGNVATNFSAGASFGYTLLWVIVAANLMAMLIQ
ncbi:divalent metal cation transporter, partial [Modestobacter roseus]|uniref:divalent metal cation transporter n=1 Tax=Modestobacter roseus TaxID=1181884 RepID=UPI0034DF6F9A